MRLPKRRSRPPVAVGEEDAFAEEAFFQSRAGAGVDAPGEAQLRRLVAA